MKRVFVGSTKKDLAEHRSAVLQAIRQLDDFYAIGMEDFGARRRPPVQWILKQVRNADVYVGLIGHCYGSIPENHDYSWTELEYNQSSPEDRLVFVAEDDVEISAEAIEEDWKRERQVEFRDRVLESRIVDFFSSPQELANKVLSALHNNYDEGLAEFSLSAGPGEYTAIVKGRSRVRQRR